MLGTWAWACAEVRKTTFVRSVLPSHLKLVSGIKLRSPGFCGKHIYHLSAVSSRVRFFYTNMCVNFYKSCLCSLPVWTRKVPILLRTRASLSMDIWKVSVISTCSCWGRVHLHPLCSSQLLWLKTWCWVWFSIIFIPHKAYIDETGIFHWLIW